MLMWAFDIHAGALVLVAIAVPFVIPFFVPLLFVFWYVRRRYVTTSREVKRWEGTTRSPVYSSFSAAVKVIKPGVPTRTMSPTGCMHHLGVMCSRSCRLQGNLNATPVKFRHL